MNNLIKHPALNRMRPVKKGLFWYYEINNNFEFFIFEKTKSKTKKELFNRFKNLAA